MARTPLDTKRCPRCVTTKMLREFFRCANAGRFRYMQICNECARKENLKFINYV